MNLIPCRFCGSSDIDLDRIMGSAFQVFCNHCDARGPIYLARAKVAGMWPKDAAIKAWNSGKHVS